MSNKRGFLLLEVIVSIAIIAGALVFVTRVYATAKYALQRSSVMLVSSLLLESSMFEYEEKREIGSDFKDSKEFAGDKGYSWAINSVGTGRDPVLNQKLDLNIVTMEVLRNKDRDERKSYITKYYITTYLFNKR